MTAAQYQIVTGEVKGLCSEWQQGKIQFMPAASKGQTVDSRGPQIHAFQQLVPSIAVADEQGVQGCVREQLVQFSGHLVRSTQIAKELVDDGRLHSGTPSAF
jgi:hypothetical protein